MAALMDRLLGEEEWYLHVWPALTDWPDSWALVRDWKPNDAVARRLDLAPDRADRVLRQFTPLAEAVVDALLPRGARELETQWSRSGPAAEVVDSMLALAAPADCYLDPGWSPLRWARFP
jgi:hypothetical protein